MDQQSLHKKFMKQALNQAEKALNKDEVPVGALIVKGERLISQAFNLREGQQDPLGHAELRAIQIASKKLNSWRLEDCDIYVTLEPCLMCMGAILQARLSRLIYASPDTKAGFSSYYQLDQQSHWKHKILIHRSVLAKESSLLLKLFFQKLRKNSPSNKILGNQSL